MVGAYAASPVHRFYQMWQQLDCDGAAATQFNGWGCVSDLFPWVEVTIGVEIVHCVNQTAT
jgi:phospholipase C